MNITTNQISNIQQYKKPTNNKFDGAGKQPQKSSNFLTFKGNTLQIAQEGVQQANKFIRKTIDKTSRKTLYTNAAELISKLDDIFGKYGDTLGNTNDELASKGYLQGLLEKAGCKIKDNVIELSNRPAIDFKDTLYTLINIPIKGLSKLFKNSENAPKFIQDWNKTYEQHRAYNIVMDILDEFSKVPKGENITFTEYLISKLGKSANQKKVLDDMLKAANNAKTELEIDLDQSISRFRDTVSSNIAKTKKQYASRDERTLNRAATSLVSAAFSASDIYNNSLIDKNNDKQYAKERSDERFKQERNRMLLSAGTTYLSLGLLERVTKQSVFKNALVIAGASLFSEIVSRLSAGKPIWRVTPEKAAKIAQKRKEKKAKEEAQQSTQKQTSEIKDAKQQNESKVTFKSNLKTNEVVFKNFAKPDGTIAPLAMMSNQNANSTSNSETDSKEKTKKGPKFLKIAGLTLAGASAFYLISNAIKGKYAARKDFVDFFNSNPDCRQAYNIDGEKAFEKIRKALDNYAESRKNNPPKSWVVKKIENGVQKLHEIAPKSCKKIDTIVNKAKDIFGKIKKLFSIKEETWVDLGQVSAKLNSLKEEYAGNDEVIKLLNIYSDKIETLGGKGVIKGKKDKFIYSAAYKGLTKIFSMLYSLASAPGKAIEYIYMKKNADIDIIYNKVKNSADLKQYKDDIIELGRLFGLEQEKGNALFNMTKNPKINTIEGVIKALATKIGKFFHKNNNSKNSSDEIIKALQRGIRNVNTGAETSELANISRTMVTVLSSIFFINDFINESLIATEGKDLARAKEEGKIRVSQKISNFIINGTLMNLFNTIFAGPLNKSLTAATIIAASTELTNETLVRKSICQPIGKQESAEKIQEYENKQLSKEGLWGNWCRFYKKITGKKSLTEKAKAKAAQNEKK